MIAAVLVVVAGLLASADAALSSISKVRAEELEREGRGGAGGSSSILDDPPRYLNTALFLRILCEMTATVLVTLVVVDLLEPDAGVQVVTAAGVMIVVSYVVVGVGPRTLGRQHAERVALLTAAPARRADRRARTDPAAADRDRQRASHPGRGFREGPFASRPSCASWSTWPRQSG